MATARIRDHPPEANACSNSAVSARSPFDRPERVLDLGEALVAFALYLCKSFESLLREIDDGHAAQCRYHRISVQGPIAAHHALR
ncbi:MAG TPA: hypothetical protein VMW17_08365 [Candidatus Binatia bacterium]|nr:hypothetical protein [Candidatus Binatia bacterium]